MGLMNNSYKLIENGVGEQAHFANVKVNMHDS